MKRSTTEQEVLKEAENQGVSLTKKQSSAIAELVDADLEASGGAMSKKARIGMYVGIGLGVAALGAGAGVLIRHNTKGKSEKEQGTTSTPSSPAPQLTPAQASPTAPTVPAVTPAVQEVPAAQQPPKQIPDGMSTFRS